MQASHADFGGIKPVMRENVDDGRCVVFDVAHVMPVTARDGYYKTKVLATGATWEEVAERLGLKLEGRDG